MDLENLVINVLSNEQYASADKLVNQFYLTPEVIDNAPTENSLNTVTSGGVYSALSNKVDKNSIKEPIHQFEVWANPTCTERPEVGRTYEDLFLQVNKAVGGNEYLHFGNGNNWCLALLVWGYDTEENDGGGYIELYVDYFTAASNYNGFPVGVYLVEWPSQAGNPAPLQSPLQYSFGEIVGYRETNNFYTKEEVNSKLNLVGQENIGNLVQSIDGYPLLLKHYDDAYNETNIVNFTDKLIFSPQANELFVDGSVFATYGEFGNITVMNSGTSNAIISSSINSLELRGEGFPVLKNTNDNYTITFPNKSGTVALTSDIPTQVQADWNLTTTSAVDYIKNKPSIPTVTFSGTSDSLVSSQINNMYITSALEISAAESHGASIYAAPTWYAMKLYVSNSLGFVDFSDTSKYIMIRNSKYYGDMTGFIDIDEYGGIRLNSLNNSLKFNNKKVLTEEDVNLEKIEPLILEGDEYYIKKNNNTILPLSHPDLSTLPSILPLRFGKNYLYEVLIPIYDDSEEFSDTYIISDNNNESLVFLEGDSVLQNSTIIETSLFGEGVLDNPTLIKESLEDYSKIPFTIRCLKSGTLTISPESSINITYSKVNHVEQTVSITGGDEFTLDLNAGEEVSFSRVSSTIRMIFGGTAEIEAFGNVMTLIYGDERVTVDYQNPEEYGFWTLQCLFKNHTNLIYTLNLVLPATSSLEYMYKEMFMGCTRLQTVPKRLPLERIDFGCCDNMFKDCSLISKSPEIYASSIATNCTGMFKNCDSLLEISLVKFVGDLDEFDWFDYISSPSGVIYVGPEANVSSSRSGWIIKRKKFYLSNSMWRIYPHIPILENLSKMKYLLVRYYNEYYPGYY